MSKWNILSGIIALVIQPGIVFSQSDLIDWQYTSSMIVDRIEAAAAVGNGYIYVLGGHGEWATDPYASVERAPILANGTLGKWIMEDDTLPLPVYGASAEVHNGYLYLIGGNVHPYQPTTTVQYAQINPDGSLGTWMTTSSLLQQRVNPAAAIHGQYIYVLGGNPTKGLTSVEYANINSDGSLGEWITTNPMLDDRWLPAAVAHNGYLYALGGYNRNSVEYAAINPDGSLAEWQYASPMNDIRSGCPGSVILNGHIYVLAGDNGSGCLNTIESAYMNPDGDLESWIMESDTLLDRRNLTACVHYGPHVYVIGGNINNIATDDVEVSGISSSVSSCGDVNCDTNVNISDAVWIINFIFIGGNDPCDTNGDTIPDC